MKTTRLTNIDLELPQVIYGCWRLADDPSGHEPARVQRKIEACLDLGIDTFDHADIYGDYRCERIFGDALRQDPQLRDRMRLISKCDIALISPGRPSHTVKHYDTSPEHIRGSVERSLDNLATDHLDLLLLHRPDPLMDAHKTAEALDELVKNGEIRAVGVSNFTPSQVDLLAAFLEAPLVVNQIELSLLHPSPLVDGSLDHCQRTGIHPMAWSPLGGGRLFDAGDPAAARVTAALRQLAQDREIHGQEDSLTQLALAWVLALPSRPTVIVGSNRVERIEAAAGAADLALERQEWFTLYEAALGHEVP